VVDGLLASMDAELDAAYANAGRDSIPPERLLRASLIQTLHSISSERVLVEHTDYNLLYRWFVGLGLDEAVWHHSTFSANRGRLLSNKHFTVESTLIEAWASMKRFMARDGGSKPPEDGGRNPTVDFKGEPRSNDTHASTTDPDARLYKKAEGEESRLGYLGHAPMENRNGLVVDGVKSQISAGMGIATHAAEH